MQSKGAIKFVAICLLLACAWQLSFTVVTSVHNNKAEKRAEKAVEEFKKSDKFATIAEVDRAFYLDSVKKIESLRYTDSISSEKVFFGYTFKEVQAQEINLGLDLKGGMNVMLQVQLEDLVKYEDAVLLERYTAVFGHLAFSLGEYQKAMLDFAEKSDSNEADRTAEGFAKMFGSYFPPEFSITEGNAWMSVSNQSVQYVSTIRPGEDVAKLVKRMHYVSFVGMFRSDLFEGLCVGHAPKKCKICGKWFLTTNARHTKYCGGYAPEDKLHRTCRQIGNLKGREQRELADDHPLKQIYEKRLNTINRYIKRGKLDDDVAEVMKKLAKDKMLRAKSNVAYAKGAYEKEMEQAALKKEALKRI